MADGLSSPRLAFKRANKPRKEEKRGRKKDWTNPEEWARSFRSLFFSRQIPDRFIGLAETKIYPPPLGNAVFIPSGLLSFFTIVLPWLAHLRSGAQSDEPNGAEEPISIAWIDAVFSTFSRVWYLIGAQGMLNQCERNAARILPTVKYAWQVGIVHGS